LTRYLISQPFAFDLFTEEHEHGQKTMPSLRPTRYRAGGSESQWAPIAPCCCATTITANWCASKDAAQHSVALTSYIFDGTGIGGQFVQALQRAHARRAPAQPPQAAGGGWRHRLHRRHEHRRRILAARRPERVCCDLHCRLRGPVVSHLAHCFSDDWLDTTGERLATSFWGTPTPPQTRRVPVGRAASKPAPMRRWTGYAGPSWGP
jgi:phosphatidylserine/phosphatidylglycerophosphate/cardiolipin synthase-like enzyme